MANFGAVAECRTFEHCAQIPACCLELPSEQVHVLFMVARTTAFSHSVRKPPPSSSSLGPTSHKSASITDKCGSEPSPIKLITKTLTLAFNTGFTRTECHPP